MLNQTTGPAGELDQLVAEIERHLLAFASTDARAEWVQFRETCSFVTNASGRGRSDDDLEVLVSKARRFRSVLLAV